MFDLEALKAAKKQVQVSHDKSSQDYEVELKEALSYIKSFSQTNDERYIKIAAQKLGELLKTKQTKPEPFFFMAYIFYIYDNKELALEYVKRAEYLFPAFPKLRELKNMIISG